MVSKHPAISEPGFQEVQHGMTNSNTGQNAGTSEELYEHSHSHLHHGNNMNSPNQATADSDGEPVFKSTSNLPPPNFESSAPTMAGEQWDHHPAQTHGQSNTIGEDGTNTAAFRDEYSQDSGAIWGQNDGQSSNPYQFQSNNPFANTPKSEF